MIVERLELVDFRNYSAATFDLTAGVTAVIGDNGQGKTNLAEALAYLATLTSMRGAPADALVRVGAGGAVIRATVRDEDQRESLIEAEINPNGRNRVQVNRQHLARARDLLGTVRVSVFSPDDLVIVKGAPSERRRFLDDTLVALAIKYDALRLELDRILRQRNTLLKQAGGRSTGEIESSLDVWDVKFADVGEQFGHARATLVAAERTDGGRGVRATCRCTDRGRTRVRATVATRRAGRRARGRATRRCAPRCVDRRSAPRRTGADARRSPGADACVAG